MPLLLLPLLLLALVAAWALLLPLALLQRYRSGKARRRAVGWVLTLNAWLLLGMAALFVLLAALSSLWVEAALLHAALGLAAGLALALAGLCLTRFERIASPRRRGRAPVAGGAAKQWFYTPNRWLVLALTAIVAARIGVGLWQITGLWRAAGPADAQAAWLGEQGSLLAVGGLLLGYYLVYAWGLRWHLRRLGFQRPGTGER